MTALGSGLLIEREHALAELAAVAAAAVEDGARLALVTGEAGIGKSSLHLVFNSSLEAPWVVEQVDGYRTDRAYAAPFGHLTGDLGDDVSADALAAAVVERCRVLARGRRLVLVIEDLHFLDPVAVRALMSILDGLADHPVLVVATSRPVAPDGDPAYEAALDELRRHPRTREIVLEPLSVAGVAAMLTDSPGEERRQSQAAAVTLHHRTGGNPFFVEAAIGAGATDEAAPVPWTVAETVSELLDDLGGGARSVAELLAVHGGPLPLDALSSVVADAERVVDLLERSGIVLVVGAGLGGAVAEARLRHALIADAVAASLDPVARVARHAQLAEVLESGGADRAADLARHLSASGESERAAPWAVIAADRLSVRGSHQRAVEMYELALTHPPEEPRLRSTLLERASVAAALAGRVELAGAWGRAAYAARTDDDRPREAGRGWANTFVLRALDDTRGEVRDPAPDPGREAEVERIADLYAASQLALELGDHAEARRLAIEVDDRAAAVGDGLGRLNGALSLILCGEVDRAAAALDAVVSEAEACADWGLASVGWSRRTRLHNVVGDTGAAARCHERSHEVGRRAGGPELWGNLVVMTAIQRALIGELDGAIDLCDEAEALELPLVGDIARLARLGVAVERGDLPAANQQLDVLVPMVRAIGIPYYSIPVLMFCARARLLEGDHDSASEVLDEAVAMNVGPTYDFEHDLLVAGAVLAHVRADDTRARVVADRLDHLATWFGGPQLVAASAFASGLGARGADDRSTAASCFAAAAQAWEVAPRWGFAADAWCALAEVSDASTARRALARASDIAAERGMPRIAWRVAVLEARGRRGAAGAGPLAGLTPQEVAVVTEAAAGRTNREIAEVLGLKERTVRNYLSSAFTKLGIERRTQLAAVVRSGDTP